MLWEHNGLALCPGYGGDFTQGILTDSGNLIVAWFDERYGHSMFVQMFNQAGDRLWRAEGVLIADGPEIQYYPAIMEDRVGGAFIIWLDTRDASMTSLYGQRIDADGKTKWPISGKHIASPVNSQRVSIMARDGKGGFIVAWDDRGLDDQVNDVYAQRIDADGNKKWGDKGVAVSTPGNRQYWPSVVSDKKGGAIIAWQDRVVTDFDNSRVIAQHLDSAGKKLWEEAGIIVSDAAGHKSFPAMEENGQGGAVVVWSDGRLQVEGRAGVYVQNISPTGALGCQIMKIDEQPLKKQTVYKDSLPATLEVIATGDDLRYQWFFNAAADYDGASVISEPQENPKFTPPTSLPGSRFYFCRVMNRCDTLYSDFSEMVVSEKISPSSVLDLRVMPNPTSFEWILEVVSPDANRFELRVIDMAGRTIFYQQGVPGNAINAGAHFASGVYLVEVQQSGQKLVKKILKL